MDQQEPSVFRQLLGSVVSGFAQGLAIIVGSGLVGAIVGAVIGYVVLGVVGAAIGAVFGAIVIGGGAIMFASWGID
ncbi:MAG: hypothetical protein LAT64_04240 [Phycisphaerales bacterium]|nr:hypothetical protein [Planctomycetota bacterium]MCH8507962.1 hypothetical protein [Phycisphaerales bacterium]